MTPERTALIVGATGSFGAHALCALLRHGWKVRALARDPQTAARRAGERMPVEWVRGDAMNPAEVAAAAVGASLIVHAANPPRYQKWRELAIPMLASTIAAAKATGARIILPGTVYNYAPNAGPHIAEDAPQAPVTRKGKVRVEMEAMLREAARQGVKSLVLRAGDFFGPAAPNSGLLWLTNRRRGRVVSVYRTGPVGHAFAYLPDLAETLARVLDREAELADFEVFHFGGHWLAGNEALGEAVRRATGDERIPIRPIPWALIRAGSPFVGMFRELLEMRYLWVKPIGLDDDKLRGFLGEIPCTPLDLAMQESLADLGVELAPAAAPTPWARSWTAPGSRPYVTAHARPNAL